MSSPRASREEGAPLLSPVEAESDEPQPVPAPPQTKSKPWIFLTALIFVVITIVDVGAFLAVPPKTRVYEANICVRFYASTDPSKIQPDGTVPEALCKVDQVQQSMAMVGSFAV